MTPKLVRVSTDIPQSPCCECGKLLDTASGETKPAPGDFALCIKCGSLNVFDAELRHRPPTVDEVLEGAKNPTLQMLRRAITTTNEMVNKLKGDKTDATGQGYSGHRH